MKIKSILCLGYLFIILASCNDDDSPNLPTTVSETISNDRITLVLEFKSQLRLQNNVNEEWTADRRQPYLDAANKWLNALVAVEGKDQHTITIGIEVGELDGGNGAARPDSEERIGNFTFPITGQMIIGNHTYAAGFDQVEFNANILHEIGHIVGIGSFTSSFVRNDPAFNGNVFRVANSKGAEMYSAIYNVDYDFVPFSDDGGHLYDYVLQEDTRRTLSDGTVLPPLTKEFMANGIVFGSVTLGVLDDIGYVVNYSAAEQYFP